MNMITQIRDAIAAAAQGPATGYAYSVSLLPGQWKLVDAGMRERFASVHELDVFITSMLQLRTTMLLSGFEPPPHDTPAWVDTLAMETAAQINANAHVRIAAAITRMINSPAVTSWPALESQYGTLRKAESSDGYPYG